MTPTPKPKPRKITYFLNVVLLLLSLVGVFYFGWEVYAQY